MLAAVINEFGRPPRCQEFPNPVLADGEVLVHVRAAGLHPLVKALARAAHYAAGGELPAVAGVDGVGTLEDGRRVYFLFVRKPWGTIAELAPAQRSMCIPVPDSISDLEAAALLNPATSAWMSLKNRAELKPGETVLILGATGVAGQLAVQAARLLGAGRVVGVGRNAEALESAGLDRIICLKDPEEAVLDAFLSEAADGIDVVVDYLWGQPAELLIQALTKQFSHTITHRTRWVQVGESAGKSITLAAGTLRSIDLHLMGSGFGANPIGEILGTIPNLFRMAAEGGLKVSALSAPLSEVEVAWERVENGQRIVFTI